MLTEFGKRVRKARIDADVSMLKMAETLGTTPSFLSAMEMGRKNISQAWARKIEKFFEDRGVPVKGLRAAADVANQSVSLDELPDDQRLLVAGFARGALDAEQIARFKRVLEELHKD